MPRSGFERVRTGCRSCKIRRVKCDEGQPECRRCQTIGRTCPGYQTPRPGSFSWRDLLLRVRPSIMPDASSSVDEIQSLDFFRCIVAPTLVGAVGSDFWTRSVMQQAMQQAPARNAVLAISFLYRRLLLLNDTDDDSSSSSSSSIVTPILYYNKALKQVATTMGALDTDAVLLLAILFTCVEFLRGNVPAAVEHCRHGIKILGGAEKASADTSAIFRHLSIFPLFFGATLSDFPHPEQQQQQQKQYTDENFCDVSKAAEMLDDLMSRCVRLVRACDAFRFATSTQEPSPSPSLLLTQQGLRQEIDEWFSRFSAGQHRLKERTLCRTLEMRWLVCKIWVDIALCRDETLCDEYRTFFERIIQLAREEAVSRNGTDKAAGLFQFDMGLSPLLYFVVIKCRFLRLRLDALELLRILAFSRESMWDPSILYAIGKRTIEREHGFDFDTAQTLEGGLQSPNSLPSKAERIRDSLLQEDTEVHVDSYGNRVVSQRIYFFIRHSDDMEVGVVPDWISFPPKRVV